MINVNVDLNFLDKPYRELIDNNHRVNVVYGSASSGKSYSLFSMAFIWLFEGRNVFICRKVAASLADSVWAQALAIISDRDMGHLFKINKNERSIRCIANNKRIVVKGLDDPKKIRSLIAPDGTPYDTILMEESDEFQEEDFNQLKTRQRAKYSKFPLRIFIVLNPTTKKSWIYKKFFQGLKWNGKRHEQDDLLIIKTTYKDNTNLDQQSIDSLESFKGVSDRHWRVYGLGEWGTMNKIVYDDIYELPKDLNMKGLQVRLGIDYGGIVDPNTFTISLFDKIKHHIYIIDTLSHWGMDFEPFAELIKECMLKNNINKNQLILCDSSDSRADRILQQYDLNIKHTRKGPGSKLIHLKWMLSNKIFIDYDQELLKESFEIYSWKKNTRGDYTSDTNHEGSDLLDAIRYSFVNDMKTNVITPTYNNNF